jgi:hypothetical protein
VFYGFEVHELRKTCGKGVKMPVKPDAPHAWKLDERKTAVDESEETER